MFGGVRETWLGGGGPEGGGLLSVAAAARCVRLVMYLTCSRLVDLTVRWKMFTPAFSHFFHPFLSFSVLAGGV